MHKRVLLFGIAISLLAGIGSAAGQEPAPAPSPAEECLRTWNYIGHKVVEMAEDWPEEKYDYQPTSDVRTFAEMLLHIAGSSYYFIDTVRGKELGEEDLSREKFKTKAEVVAAVKKSFEEGAALIEQVDGNGMEKSLKHPFANRMINQYGFWMAQVEHIGEHYGNLVVYYRLNNIVPPASRRGNN